MSKIAHISNQRKLVASDDLDQQIATLNSLINNPPQNSRTVEIGPKLAEYILANINIGNRPKKVKKIAIYATDMLNDNWSLTGDAIKFGTDGHLKDGQNRLAACVRSGASFVTDARFGHRSQVIRPHGRGRSADQLGYLCDYVCAVPE